MIFISVQFNKTGVVHAYGNNDGILVTLSDESGNDLVNNNEILTNTNSDEYGYAHGFIEGANMMSIYSDDTIFARDFIEW